MAIHGQAMDNGSREREETRRSGSLPWYFCGSPYGIRTRAATLRVWCPRPLDERAVLRLTTLPSGRHSRKPHLESATTDPEGRPLRWLGSKESNPE
jgi:hypothetical protein